MLRMLRHCCVLGAWVAAAGVAAVVAGEAAAVDGAVEEPDDEDPEATGATDRCEELEKPEGRTAGDTCGAPLTAAFVRVRATASRRYSV